MSTLDHRVKIYIEFRLLHLSMQSFDDNFEGSNHRYFNRKQYRYLHLLPKNFIRVLSRVETLYIIFVQLKSAFCDTAIVYQNPNFLVVFCCSMFVIPQNRPMTDIDDNFFKGKRSTFRQKRTATF